jgi:predicted RNA binding protein YcfA (HicA-like mRNA interferase family)
VVGRVVLIAGNPAWTNRRHPGGTFFDAGDGRSKRLHFPPKAFDLNDVTAYSYIVVRAEKLLKEARNNPAGMSFKDFEKLMDLKGWRFARQKGSHRLWISPSGGRLPVQPRGNKAKEYQIRQFLKQFDAETAEHKKTGEKRRGEGGDST